MTLTMACLLVTIGICGRICLYLYERIQSANFVIDDLASKINYLEQKVDLNKRSIKLQNESIRDVYGVVKKIVKENEPAEPDTKALISGWGADEAEPEDPVKNHIVDICLNGTYEQKQGLIDAMTLQNILLSQTQQCNYHTLQSTLLGQTQQSIYPLQSGQFQSCSMLPLWYINRRLEDM